MLHLRGVLSDAPFYRLAAAAVVVTAAAIAAAQERTATAVAQDENQNDDPANVTATETIVVAHNHYLQKFSADDPLIPRYSPATKRCNDSMDN